MRSETKYVEILKAAVFGTEKSIEIPKERYVFPEKRQKITDELRLINYINIMYQIWKNFQNMMNIATTSKPVFKLYDCSNFSLSKTNFLC